MDPSLKGNDIENFTLEPIYTPLDIFENVIDALQTAQNQYGTRSAIKNESGVASYISPVKSSLSIQNVQILSTVPKLFLGDLTNNLEFTMAGRPSMSGCAEITLFTGPTAVVLIGEMKCVFDQDPSKLLAQKLVEADGTHNFRK